MRQNEYAALEAQYDALDDQYARGGILVDDDIDFEKYLQETETGEKVRSVSNYANQVLHVISPTENEVKPAKLPFINSWLYFNPGEITIWAGYNNAGKSALQGQVMDEFAAKGERICIASMEMTPARTLARICRQRIGTKFPSKDQVYQLLNERKGFMWVYDQQGTVDKKRMIAVIKHCAEKLKCSHIVIDSLMKCLSGVDDYNAQKDFVNDLTVAARDFKTHIHLVAHLKKPELDSNKIPNRYSIKGTSEISDLADNVVIVWRNEAKERAADSGKPFDTDSADSVLIVDKSRNCDWTGRVQLWFDDYSGRFSDTHKPKRIL